MSMTRDTSRRIGLLISFTQLSAGGSDHFVHHRILNVSLPFWYEVLREFQRGECSANLVALSCQMTWPNESTLQFEWIPAEARKHSFKEARFSGIVFSCTHSSLTAKPAVRVIRFIRNMKAVIRKVCRLSCGCFASTTTLSRREPMLVPLRSATAYARS
jgi:hypothetical protein